MADNNINKLMDSFDNSRNLLETNQHAQDAAELKRQWFNYVFASLEKAHAAISELKDEVHQSSSAGFKNLVDAKESIRGEIGTLQAKHVEDIDKLEAKLEAAIDKLKNRLDAISLPELRKDLEKDIEAVKSSFDVLLNNLRREITEKNIEPLRDSVIILKVKIAMWGVLGGIVGSGVITFILQYFFQGP